MKHAIFYIYKLRTRQQHLLLALIVCICSLLNSTDLLAQVPALPTGLTATAASSTQVNLAWTDASSNETGFQIERSTTSGTGFVLITTTAANVISFSNTGLTANTRYFYRIRSTNGSGSSPNSTEVSVSTSTPAAPTTLAAVAASSTQINLTWVDASTTETGFWIERSITSGSGFALIATAPANAVSFSNTGLTASTTYFYRIRAVNGSLVSSFTAQVSAATSVPIAPTTLVATASSSTQINLTWSDASTNETGFQVERSTTSGTGFALVTTTAANTTSFSNTGLTAGTQYFYRIRAVNAVGASAPTTEATASTSAPAVPTSLVANATSTTQINLSWVDASTNETGFQVERSTTSGTGFVLITTTAANAVSFSNTGLTANTRCFYRVRSVNAVGTSVPTAEASALTSAPAAPTTLTAIAASSTQVNLTWVDASTSETGFQIERSLTSGSGFSLVSTAAANATSFSNTGLTANTVYFYRVRAINGSITSGYAPQATASTSAPLPPTTLSASAFSSTQINLTWVDASNNETGFQVERSTTSGSGYTLVSTTAANATSFSNTGLTANTSYFYRVRAINAVGSSNNTPEFATSTTTPVIPTTLAAVVSSTTQINLTWVDASNNETGFQIERSTTSGSGFTLINTTAANATAFSNTGLTAGTRYFYRIRSTNGVGSSLNTPEAVAVANLVAPTALTATPVSQTQVNLTWTDASSNETGFQIERSLTAGAGFALVTTTAANATSFSNTGLTAGTQYFYRVRAINNSGSGLSAFTAEANMTTPEIGNVPDLVEFNALKDLFTSTNGANWTNKTNWPTTWPAKATAAEMGTWFGVGVTNGDVTSLNFISNNLNGGLSPSLGNLTELTYMGFRANAVTGAIPSTWSTLTKLNTFDFSYTSLTGSIPSFFSSFTQLTVFQVLAAGVTGAIPNLSASTNLQVLFLEANFTPAPLPSWLQNMTNLTHLLLQNCKVTGDIPNWIGGNLALRSLDLSKNSLTGSIPASIGNLTQLQGLSLYENQLTGAIPSSIGNLANASYIGLYYNNLTGSIPTEIGGLANVRYLYLWNNQLTGEIPASVGNLTALAYFRVENNILTGPLPDLSGLPLLAQIIAYNNQLSGPLLASYFSNAMIDFQMYSNRFSGTLPDITRWPNINAYLVQGNQFTGAFPSFDPAFFPNLAYINANGNKLTSIPTAVLNLPNVGYYGFANNQINEITGLAAAVSSNSLHPNTGSNILLENNQLDYSEIEALKGLAIPTLTYAPQNPINDFSTKGFISASLVIPARPTGQYSTVMWEKQQPNSTWLNINAQNQDATQSTFTKASPTIADEGIYRWTMTNSLITDVTLQSVPITVFSEGAVPDAIEYAALKDLFLSTNGAGWTNKTNWPTTWPTTASAAQMGTWSGIAVENGDVITIEMPGNSMYGPMPASIGNLTSLKNLIVYANNITGTIPAEWASLTKLEYLDFRHTAISGNLPTFPKNFPNLIWLSFTSANLTGSIPDYSGLQNLRWFGVGGDFIAGPIPDWIQTLPSLAYLVLSYSNRTGPIPAWVGSKQTLLGISFDNNLLTGEIPASLGNLPYLGGLILSFNKLTGTIPTTFANRNSLQTFYVSNNELSGSLPSNLFSGMTGLVNLDIRNNKFTGSFPSSIANATNLGYFIGSGNQFTSVPNTISNLTNLYWFDFSNNQLQAVPDFSQHPNRTNMYLTLNNNQLDFSQLDAMRTWGMPLLTALPQNDIADNLVYTIQPSPLIIPARPLTPATTINWEKQQSNGSWTSVNSLSNDASLQTFRLNSPQASDEGVYRWRTTNTNFSGSTIQSAPIQVNTISTLTSAPVLYNGLITTARWRTDKAYGYGPADSELSGMYLYDYDEKYQLKEALFARQNSSANGYVLDGNNFRLTGMQYDPNGNIQSLKRYGDKGQLQHNFGYTYQTNTNKLANVSNYASYTYNAIGQMTAADKTATTEADQFVDYDVTGKVVAVYEDAAKTKPTARYTYDDRGFRLTKVAYPPATQPNGEIKTTWYIRDASGNVLSIYEQTLDKVKNDGSSLYTQTEVPIYGAGKLATYYPAHSVAADQSNTDAGSTAYEITDHLGNVRALVRIHANEYTATMEDDGTATYINPRVRENVYFKNLFETEKRDVQMNHTDASITASPSRAANLQWISGHPDPNFAPDKKSVGPAIALSVSPGDQIDLSAWARFKIKASYTNAPIKAIIASALAGQYVFSNGLESITQAATALNSGVLAAVPSNQDDPNAPKAYINYVIFNSSYLVVNGGALQVPASAGFEEAQRNSPYNNANLVKFESPVTIAQPGYIYVWVSNESENTEVWFDDVSVIHHKPLVAQATDYEAWGGILREQKWVDLDAKYRYGYQGKYAEKDDETGWNHFELREYDPVIGRWISRDPKKQFFSGYIGMGNNVINKVDPDGGFSRIGSIWRSWLIPGSKPYYHSLEKEWAVGWETNSVEGGMTNTTHHYITEGGPGLAVPSGKFHWHIGGEYKGFKGSDNFDLMAKNGIGVTYRDGAQVFGEVSASTYYPSTNKSFGIHEETTKYVTEHGVAGVFGYSRSVMTEVHNATGKPINIERQTNLGVLFFGIQINEDQNGELKDVRYGLDGGFGLSGVVGAKLNLQIGGIYIPKKNK